MKKICVLLAVYNGERYLREQIDSILHQRIVDVSILIRDDGSKDGSKSILKEYEKQENVEVIYGQNLGCANSFRALLEAAYDKLGAFDYFAFSDQDDVWLPEKLSVACGVLEMMDATRPCAYCSNVMAVDAQLNEIGTRWDKSESFITKAQSLVCSMSHGCTMLFNGKVIEIFHQYPPQKIVLHDLWVMHMCMFLGDIQYDPNPYILYRQHGNNVLGAKNTIASRLQSRWKSIQFLFKQHYNEQEAKEILRAYGAILQDKDKELIGTVAYYKSSIKNRIKFLFSKDIRRKHDNFWLTARIILGTV